MRKATIGAILSLIAGASLVFLAGEASADQVYHSERLPLADTGLAGHPALRSGHVVNIHPNGPRNGALERYMVSGAAPGTTYQVVLQLQAGNCSGAPLGPFPSVLINTDAQGNGHGKLLITRDFIDDAGLAGAQLGVTWELQVGGAGGPAAYTTACTNVAID